MCSTPPTRATSAAPMAISPAPAGRRGQGAGAHPVDREARDRGRQTGEERDVASERQALVADLRGGGEDDVVDPLGRELRVPSQHLAYGFHGHVVGARPARRSRQASRGRTPCARRRRTRPREALPRPRRYFRGDGRLGGTSRAGARSLRGRRGAAPGRPGRAAAAADADGERGVGGGSVAAHARSARGGERVASARGRDVPDELAGRAAGKLGPPDRGDEVTVDRRRPRRCARRRGLGARGRRADVGEPDRPLRGELRAARARRRRGGDATRRDPRRRAAIPARRSRFIGRAGRR